jgi:hypothetical protein
LRRKSKEWYKKLVDVPIGWHVMKATMLLKYGNMDKEEV